MSNQNKKTILLVEDSTLAQKLVQEALVNFNLLIASDTPEAYEFLENNCVDLILLDINLPTETGFIFCKNVRSKKQTSLTPIIFLTGSEKNDDIIMALESGGNDYLKKPFSNIELSCRIENQLMIKELNDKQMHDNQVKTIETVITTVNHLVNNPLSVAMLNLYQIKKSNQHGEQVEAIQESLVEINENIQRMNHLLKADYSTVLNLKDQET